MFLTLYNEKHRFRCSHARVCQILKPNWPKNRPSFYWSRIRPANGARICPISMVPCERKAELDEFKDGLKFIRSRVNGVLKHYNRYSLISSNSLYKEY